MLFEDGAAVEGISLIAMVGERGVNSRELLQLLDGPEPGHRVLSLSKGLA